MKKTAKKKIRRKGGDHVVLGIITIASGIVGIYLLLTQFYPMVHPLNPIGVVSASTTFTQSK